jgi:hypothetical protein
MDAIDKFAKSKARYPLLGMQLNDIPIFGHTHRPYIDIENRVANTGAWPAWFPNGLKKNMVKTKHVLDGTLRSTTVNISWYHMGYTQKRRKNGSILNQTKKKKDQEEKRPRRKYC